MDSGSEQASPALAGQLFKANEIHKQLMGRPLYIQFVIMMACGSCGANANYRHSCRLPSQSQDKSSRYVVRRFTSSHKNLTDMKWV